MSDERYPVGPLQVVTPTTAAQRSAWLREVEGTPAALRAAVAGLDDAQLDTPYREGGWTVRQVVHHLPDSHMNAYIRLCTALTEEQPTIRPYNEAEWAKIGFSQSGPIEVSLRIMDALHERWMAVLRDLGEAEWERPYVHPESGVMRVDGLLQVYAWHGRHHVAHITSLRARRGW